MYRQNRQYPFQLTINSGTVKYLPVVGRFSTESCSTWRFPHSRIKISSCDQKYPSAISRLFTVRCLSLSALRPFYIPLASSESPVHPHSLLAIAFPFAKPFHLACDCFIAYVSSLLLHCGGVALVKLPPHFGASTAVPLPHLCRADLFPLPPCRSYTSHANSSAYCRAIFEPLPYCRCAILAPPPQYYRRAILSSPPLFFSCAILVLPPPFCSRPIVVLPPPFFCSHAILVLSPPYWSRNIFASPPPFCRRAILAPPPTYSFYRRCTAAVPSAQHCIRRATAVSLP